MIQAGFFDFSERFKALSKTGDHLEKLNKVINWELFREPIEKIIQSKNKSLKGGRPSYDCILMFKIILLQILYNLSDDQTDFQIRDRFSFMRFLGILLTDKIPDVKTIWLFKENLRKNNGVKELFDEFENILKELGFFAKSGQIVDASIIKAPIRRTGRKDNELIKNGKTLKTGLIGHRLKNLKLIWMPGGQKRGINHILGTKYTQILTKNTNLYESIEFLMLLYMTVVFLKTFTIMLMLA